MPLSQYEQALADLPNAGSQTAKRAIESWSTDARLGQVGKNIAAETALEAADFVSLLRAFAEELDKGASSADSWITACRAHKLKGRIVPDLKCPATLGRVRNLEDHARSLATASGGTLTQAKARRLLLKYSEAVNSNDLYPFLHEALLGKYVVWASFDKDHPDRNPFDRLPKTREGIRIAIGLGHLTADDSLILLVWGRQESGSPSLHRPTVADAGDNPYYRPVAEASDLYGFTEPLPPNPDGLPPQPEVVMPETTSQGLRLPFRVLQA